MLHGRRIQPEVPQRPELPVGGDALTGQQPHQDRERFVGARARPSTGTPLAANSGGNSPPTPTPRSKRPREIRSRVDASFAAIAIGYSGRIVSALSSRTRSVTAAAAARVTKALAVGP